MHFCYAKIYERGPNRMSATVETIDAAPVLVNNKKPGRFRAKRTAKRASAYFAMTLIAVFMMFPLYYTVVTSMRARADIALKPTVFFPEQISFANFGEFFELLSTRYGPSIGRVMFNTVLNVGSIIIISLTLCALAAYSLALLNYAGKKAIVKFMFASMMIPGVVSLVPSFMLISRFGMLGNPLGIIIPASYSIYGTLFLRAFFLQTPKELAEAARIDGAGEMRIFSGIYLRLVLPGLITLGLFTFNAHYNSFLWPRLVLMSPTAREWVPIAVAMREFQGAMQGNVNQGVVMSAALITVLPTVTIFLVGQKFFMNNLAFAGIK